MSVFVRSMIFNALFFTTVPLIFVLGSPLLLLRTKPFFFAHYTTRYILWLTKVVCGISYKVEGWDKIPSGPCIIACKHQSFWETVVFQALIPDISIIYKIELTRVPIYGGFTKKLNGIPIDRKKGTKALRDMQEKSAQMLKDGFKVLIFPEGTRSAVGQAPSYQKGAYFIYKGQSYPVVPVALNSGLFWPRRSWLKHPGAITLKFLDPIEPGLDSKDFMSQLVERIEGASNALLPTENQTIRKAS